MGSNGEVEDLKQERERERDRGDLTLIQRENRMDLL